MLLLLPVRRVDVILGHIITRFNLKEQCLTSNIEPVRPVSILVLFIVAISISTNRRAQYMYCEINDEYQLLLPGIDKAQLIGTYIRKLPK